MFVRHFDPNADIIDRVVLGSGDWPIHEEIDELSLIKSKYPMRTVTRPLVTIPVAGLYSLDFVSWYDRFPGNEALHLWKDSSYSTIEGIVRFSIQIEPIKNMAIREIGLFCGEDMYVYRIINECVIGRVDKTSYTFNYHLKCIFFDAKTAL